MTVLQYIIVVSLIIAAPVAWFLPNIIRRWRRNEEIRAALIEHFYESAQKALKHEAVSEEIARSLVAMGAAFSQPSAMRGFAFLWITGGLSGPVEQHSSFEEKLNAMPEEFRCHFIQASALSLFGSTYSAPITGWLVRQLLFRPVGLPDHTEESSRFTAGLLQHVKSSGNHPNGDAPPLAA